MRMCNNNEVSKPTHDIEGHQGEIYTLDFSPFNEFLFLTGINNFNKFIKFYFIIYFLFQI